MRTLSTSAVRKDLIKDLYLRELKSYKPPTKGNVREFPSAPNPEAPSAPSSAELSSQLEAYVKQQPDAAQPTANTGESTSESQDINAYLEELQADVKVEAHH
ncbi:hypothetical protein MVES1_002460 [Malassezia vespertilionis]|uniref:Uncharacterized protein n=1 Tax=Malassezia vespertilionis TaxID=2020962 RepID=A0A2N1JAV3_9BASI|nr:uncharacterized protein MVES1_002460 [Malassezia vespertilionis]PKI83663.1 hypothetical protein MVES_002323 [Malassezia vespertilionis]WFD07103.1 hypothetical protein MVES1_002460 [Malassezia vespertilionis]